MIEQLACPLVPKRVEHRDSECDSIHEAIQKAPLPTAALHSTGEIVHQPDANRERQVLGERLDKSNDIELFLACRVHVGQEENSVMATQEAHESRVLEEICARLLPFFISRLEGRLTCVED
jgi:hypothetical protein